MCTALNIEEEAQGQTLQLWAVSSYQRAGIAFPDQEGSMMQYAAQQFEDADLLEVLDKHAQHCNDFSM